MTDAIREDAPGAKRDRRAVLQQMMSRRQADRPTEDDAPTDDIDGAETEDNGAELEASADVPEADESEEEAASPEPARPKARKLRVKVDGEEMEVTEDDLIRSYQKDAAATRRLQEAAELRRQAELLYNQQLQAQQQPPQGEPAGREPVQDDDRRTRAMEVARMFAIDPDDEDEVNKATDAIMGLVGKQQDPDDVAARVRAQIAQERQREVAQAFTRKVKEADEWFATEYQDVAEDEELFAVAKWKAEQLFKETGIQSDPKELYAKAGDFARKLSGGNAPATDSARLERKRAATAATARPNSARQPRPQEKRPPTAKERLEMMRQKRGQGVRVAQ